MKQENLITQLQNLKGSNITLGTFDLLERIDCPWIRLARDNDGQVVIDEKTHAPVLANHVPTMAEFGKTAIVLLTPSGNPNIISWVTSGKINDMANRLLAGLSNVDLPAAYQEIRRILQAEEKSKEKSDDEKAG